MDVIGMTNLQEAKLAREAEICYSTIALVTDYDCWHPSHAEVTVEMIVANLMQNARTAQQVIATAVGMLAVRPHLRMRDRASACADHPARRGARRDSKETGADCRQVPGIRK